MNRTNYKWMGLVFVISVFGLFSMSCSELRTLKLASAANGTTPVKVEAVQDANLIESIHPELFPLVKVETKSIADQLVTNGTVTPDVARTVPVNSIAGGRVLDIRARLGDDVRKGQILLVIDSPDLASALADYRRSVSAERLAQKAYDRTKALYEHKAVPLKDVLQVEEDLQRAKVDKQTATERIRIIGGVPDQPSPIIEVKSPVSGTVLEQNTTRGAAIKSLDNSPSLFTVADLSRVWVLCDLYENRLPDVKVGDRAEVILNAYQDRTFMARVGHISKLLDPATRTAKVRLELDNSHGLLRPGMFVTARFISREEKARAVVPMSTIIRLHDKNWVFRWEGENRFRRTEVQTGGSLEGGLQEILKGLQAGDQVVENALQFAGAAMQKDS
ncbi:MAG: efflux RND transporter periplasmic adaptor subunit [Acidobacteria bacterium]|nr:efflux RND transporter periplasmic adaptor subunit [Acidobacteriota bacterium]MBI3656005.1 efflux RND transporter periplasmic adaptor subunit [Acidobacteriota bacterium]